jgi:hypothetical protein
MTRASPNFCVRPLLHPQCTLDLHEPLVRAIEVEIGRRFGGNPVLNRLEAEAQLMTLMGSYAGSADSQERSEVGDGAAR